MARKLIDRYQATITSAVAAGDLAISVSGIPAVALAAGRTVRMTFEDVRGAPTKHENFIVESWTGTTLTTQSGGRGADGTTAQTWEIDEHVTAYIWSDDVEDRVRNTGEDFTALGISPEYHDNGASGAADRANGEACKITLTAAATAITVTGLSATKSFHLLEIYDADTYAPDISALTPLINEATVTFGKMTRILAEYCGDGTTRFTYLGYSAT